MEQQQVNLSQIGIQELTQLLEQLFQPNTQAIKEATAILKDYFKTIQALENLLILLSTSENQNIRQVSCVYLRKIIGNLWLHLNKENQEKTKILLLERFVVEPVPLIKKNIADIIGTLGKILIPNKEWNELFVFFFQKSQSEHLQDKELSMVLLSVIIEYFSIDEIKTYYDQLNTIIEGFLASEFSSLKTLAIETVNKIAQNKNAVKILRKYKNLIPLVIKALSLDQEDMIQKVFETFNEFIEVKKVLQPHLPMLIDAALKVSANTDFNINLREITMMFLELIAEKYGRIIPKKKNGMALLDSIISTGFLVASESEDGYEEEQETPHSLALLMIYKFTCEVPLEKIYPIVLKYIQSYGVSQIELQRKAAIKVLGYVADSDSCLDKIKDDIDDLTNFIVQGLQDPSFIVRESSAETVGKFSEFVVPDFLDKHAQVVPCLLNVLKELSTMHTHGTNDLNIQKGLFALNEFTTNLDGGDIKLYLNDILVVLLQFLQNVTYSKEVKYWALTALGSVEGTASLKILPYMNDILKALLDIVNNTAWSITEYGQVKSQAIMCAGQLASAVGKERFPNECVEIFTKHALSFIKEENRFELRESAISYFAELCRILKNDMAPIFDQVLTEVLNSCKSDKGIQEIGAQDSKDNKQFSLDSDSDEEGSVAGVDVDVNFIDEKASAVHALGYLCLFCPSLMLPRLQEILSILSDIGFYFHENIRYHVCLTYTQISFGLLKHFSPESWNDEEKFEWKKGLPPSNVLHEKVQEFLDTIVFPHYFKIFEEEQSKEVIEKMLECIRDLLDELGPCAVVNQIDKIVHFINLLLDKKAFCQTKLRSGENANEDEDENDDDEEGGDGEEDEEDMEDDEEDLDHDEIILGNTTDLINSLAKALGDQFLIYLQIIAPRLVRYLDDSHPKSDKTMVIGCLAETFNGCTAAIPAYFNDFMQVIYKNATSNDSGLNRNCAYAIGIIAEYAKAFFPSQINNCLQLLGQMYDNSEEQDAKDNVVAASCRILINYPNEVPFDSMLQSILSKIPFNGDVNENETILKFVFNLYLTNKEKVEPYMGNITFTCMKVLVDEKCDEIKISFKKDVGKFIKNCIMTSGEQNLAILRDLEQKMSQIEKEQLGKYIC